VVPSTKNNQEITQIALRNKPTISSFFKKNATVADAIGVYRTT
jgi:hypothetical protein